MNLIRLFSGKRAIPQATPLPEARPSDAAAMPSRVGGQIEGDLSKVVPIRQNDGGLGTPSMPWAAAALCPGSPAAAPPAGAQVAGLLSAPELQGFLGRDHYASGRHHGSVFRSLEALERGREAIVSSFQNEAAALSERRHAHLDKLLLEQQRIEGLSADMTQTLNVAAAQLRREIDLLGRQIEWAGQRRGWVLDALNRYQLGFDRGVRDALAFELLQP